MIIYIIASVILFLSVGAFFGLMVVSLMENTKSKAKKWVVGIITSILVSGAITAALVADRNIDMEQWNNGVCPNVANYGNLRVQPVIIPILIIIIVVIKTKLL